MRIVVAYDYTTLTVTVIKMESAIRVQIFDEPVCILLRANDPGKKVSD